MNLFKRMISLEVGQSVSIGLFCLRNALISVV